MQRNVPELHLASAVHSAETAPAAAVEKKIEPEKAAASSNELYKRYAATGQSAAHETETEKQGLFSRIASGLSSFAHTVAEKAGSAYSTAKNIVSNPGEFVSDLKEGASNKASSLWNGIKEFASHPIDSILGGIKSFGEKISSAVETIGSWLGSLASSLGSQAGKSQQESGGFFGSEAKVWTTVAEVAKQVVADAAAKEQAWEISNQKAKQNISLDGFGNNADVMAKMNDVHVPASEVAAAIRDAREQRDRREAEKLKETIAQTENQTRSPGTSPDTYKKIEERHLASAGRGGSHELTSVEKERIQKEASGSTESEVTAGVNRLGAAISSKLPGAAGQLSELLFRHRDDEGIKEMLDNPSAISKRQMAEIMRRLNVEITA